MLTDAAAANLGPARPGGRLRPSVNQGPQGAGCTIGAGACRKAALDPPSDRPRGTCRLQPRCRGSRAPRRNAAALDELLGPRRPAAEAADRKVARLLRAGMKAAGSTSPPFALVHRPVDSLPSTSPTTGPRRPEPNVPSGAKVGRPGERKTAASPSSSPPSTWRRPTSLADRVGIIDHGRIVGRGDAGRAEGRGGGAARSRAIPADSARPSIARPRILGPLRRASSRPPRAPPCALNDGSRSAWRRSLRAASTRTGSEVRESPAPPSPRSDDVFPRQDRPLARRRRPTRKRRPEAGPGDGVGPERLLGPGLRARPALGRAGRWRAAGRT